MPNKETQNQVEIDTIRDEEPYDPNSQRKITIDTKEGTIEITIQEWLKRLNTNGRGGT